MEGRGRREAVVVQERWGGVGGEQREGREKERKKKNDLMKFRYQLRTNMQNISLEIK